MDYINKQIDIISVLFLVIMSITSLIVKTNILVTCLFLIIGVTVIIYFYMSEKRLLSFAIFSSLVAPFLSSYVSVLAYLPQISLILMLVKLCEKKIVSKEKMRLDKITVVSVIAIIAIGLISLFYEQGKVNCNIFFLLYVSLKRFGWVIVYIYTLNIELDSKDLNKLLKYIGIFLLLQIPVILIQFIGGTNRDFITGIMGNNATGYALQFFILYFLFFIQNKDSSFKFECMYLLLLLIYCAIAEVKVGFFIIPILFIACILKSQGGFQKILLCILAILGLYFAYKFLVIFNPNQGFLNQGFINNYLTKSYIPGKETLNRSGFMPTLKQTILTKKSNVLFGRGLGSANSHETISLLQGHVYVNYGYLEFTGFFFPTMIIEFGIIGLAIYVLIFIRLLIKFFKISFKEKQSKIIYGIITLIITFIFFTYNNSILNSFYVIFFTGFLLASNYKLEKGKEHEVVLCNNR